MAVGAWGLSPSDFYELTPEEWWRIYEMKRPREKHADYAGQLTDSDCEALYELING